MYAYRSLTLADYDELYALWRATPGVGLSEADERGPIARYLARNEGQSFACVSEGGIVGAILCGNDGRRAYIHHLAVSEVHRRRGIGSELLRRAVERQREMGIQKCHLFIFADNASGRAFWAAQGFALREDIQIMSRNL